MKCVETFKTGEAAQEKRRLLMENGIDAKVFVDPLECRYPALSGYQDVALMVHSDFAVAAADILRAAMLRKAS
jgi:hypothetical protein